MNKPEFYSKFKSMSYEERVADALNRYLGQKLGNTIDFYRTYSPNILRTVFAVQDFIVDDYDQYLESVECDSLGIVLDDKCEIDDDIVTIFHEFETLYTELKVAEPIQNKDDDIELELEDNEVTYEQPELELELEPEQISESIPQAHEQPQQQIQQEQSQQQVEETPQEQQPNSVKSHYLCIDNILDEFSGKVALCTDAQIKETKNNKKYLWLTLNDCTGKSIEAKKWNESSKDLCKLKSCIVKIKGSKNVFNNETQLILTEIKPLTSDILETYNINREDFMLKPLIDMAESMKYIMQCIQCIPDEEIRKFTHFVFLESGIVTDYLESKAGIKYHHTIKGELINHTYEVVKACIAMSEIFKFYKIDLSYLIAGAILHDIGKIREMPRDDSMEYTYEGYALGHIAIGIQIISEYAVKLNLDSAKRNKLIHMIATHHGTKENGSPIEANSMEAFILNHCDTISAELYNTNVILYGVPSGQYGIKDRKVRVRL